MALSFQPFFPQSLQNFALANAAVTSTQNVIVGGVNGTKVETLLATSNDTVDHLLSFSINIGGTNYLLGTALVAANTGNLVGNQNGTNLFSGNVFLNLPQDPNGNKYLYIANGSCGLTVKSNSANAATGGVVSISGQAAVF